jgi:hypothetical protein
MEQQPSTSTSISVTHPIVSKQRSLPIPKVVNNYILNNYGAAYYGSQNITEKQEILSKIESACVNAGYVNIRADEIERRLKNMKSHYRRKKLELTIGSSHSVVWEYYSILDAIFTELDKNKPIVECPIVPKVEVVVGQKRPAGNQEPKVAKQEVEVADAPKPQDL